MDDQQRKAILPQNLLDLDHSTTEPEDEVKRALFLDIIVRESPTILQLLSSEDQSLLIWRNSLLVLDLSLDVLNAIGGLDLESDGLAGQSLDEDLHSSSESENQMKGGLLLDVVVGESSSVLQLLASEDQPLLIWGNALLVLNFGLDILDSIRSLNLKGDGLSSQSLDKNLHDL